MARSVYLVGNSPTPITVVFCAQAEHRDSQAKALKQEPWLGKGYIIRQQDLRALLEQTASRDIVEVRGSTTPMVSLRPMEGRCHHGTCAD